MKWQLTAVGMVSLLIGADHPLLYSTKVFQDIPRPSRWKPVLSYYNGEVEVKPEPLDEIVFLTKGMMEEVQGRIRGATCFETDPLQNPAWVSFRPRPEICLKGIPDRG